MANDTPEKTSSRYVKLTVAALSGLLVGGTLVGCNSSSKKASTPTSQSANGCGSKDGCGAKHGCGANGAGDKSEARSDGTAKAGCGAKHEAKSASSGKAACGGKNGCG